MHNRTYFRPRVNTIPPVEANQIAAFGIPGIPFPEPTVVSPVFSQGEDVIYDGIIYIDNAPIDPSKWVVNVILKKSEYAIGVIWEGTLGNGLFYTPSTQQFQIWIPSSVTAQQLAGTYWFDVRVTENAGANTGVRPRTIVIATYDFSLKYTMASPHPESNSDLPKENLRVGAERTYPNVYNPLNPSL